MIDFAEWWGRWPDTIWCMTVCEPCEIGFYPNDNATEKLGSSRPGRVHVEESACGTNGEISLLTTGFEPAAYCSRAHHPYVAFQDVLSDDNL